MESLAGSLVELPVAPVVARLLAMLLAANLVSSASFLIEMGCLPCSGPDAVSSCDPDLDQAVWRFLPVVHDAVVGKPLN